MRIRGPAAVDDACEHFLDPAWCKKFGECAAASKPRYCTTCRLNGNDDSRLGRDVVHNIEGAPPEGLLAEVCEQGHVFALEGDEEGEGRG